MCQEIENFPMNTEIPSVIACHTDKGNTINVTRTLRKETFNHGLQSVYEKIFTREKSTCNLPSSGLTVLEHDMILCGLESSVVSSLEPLVRPGEGNQHQPFGYQCSVSKTASNTSRSSEAVSCHAPILGSTSYKDQGHPHNFGVATQAILLSGSGQRGVFFASSELAGTS